MLDLFIRFRIGWCSINYHWSLKHKNVQKMYAKLKLYSHIFYNFNSRSIKYCNLHQVCFKTVFTEALFLPYNRRDPFRSHKIWFPFKVLRNLQDNPPAGGNSLQPAALPFCPRKMSSELCYLTFNILSDDFFSCWVSWLKLHCENWWEVN